MAKIDTREWQEFRIWELFETKTIGNKIQVPTGANIPTKDLSENGSIPRITVTGVNNGISGTYDYCGGNTADYRVFENFISVSFLGTVFYHEEKASLDMKVHCLKPIDMTLNQYIGHFLVTAIKASLKGSSYADQISSTVLPQLSIKLPTTPAGLPDYAYMEEYMRRLEDSVSSSLTALQSAQEQEKKKIDVSEWKPFHLYDIFEISMGNKFDRSKMTQNNQAINFVGRSALNNGVACVVDFVNKNGAIVEPYKAGDITIAMGGSIGSAFVQEKDFYTSQNVCVLHTDNPSITKHVKQFIVTAIIASCNNYEAFVDELNRHIKTDFVMYLPVTSDGNPDWEYMESYMRKIELYTTRVLNNVKQLGVCN